MRWFFGTDATDRTLAWLRIAVGLVMLPHGLQKTLGLFGGQGFAGTMQGMSTGLGVPAPVVFLVIMAESIGALMLITGFGVRLAAFGNALVMLGAIFMVHGKYGFFMDWFGTQGGHGIEFHLLFLAALAPVLVKGAGAWSVDARFARRTAESAA